MFLRLDGLADGPHPVVDRVNARGVEAEGVDEFEINPLGERLLGDEDDWQRLSGGRERWIGGVRVDGGPRGGTGRTLTRG